MIENQAKNHAKDNAVHNK